MATFEDVPPDFDVHYEADLWERADDLREGLAGADALIVRNRTQVTADLVGAAERLMVVGRLGAGLDNVDVSGLEARGVKVVYAPDANTQAVVEYCLAQVLAALRLVHQATASTVEGQWDRAGHVGKELAESTIGVVGFGRSGKRLAETLGLLGADVLIHTRRPEVVGDSFETVELAELLRRSDVVSLHVPGGHATRHLIGPDELALMGPDATLLNASRGDVVDEAALLRTLEDGGIRAAILDVRETEPPVRGQLEETGRLLPTPHIAAFTEAAQKRVSSLVLSDVDAVLRGKTPQYPAVAS